MTRLLKYIAIDIFKNKIVITYCILLGLLSWSVFNLESSATKGILSLLNIVLLVVPLISVLFSTIYVYNSNEFIELLVSQPIKRSKIWIALFLSMSSSLILAYLIGVGIPLFIYADFMPALIMTSSGVLLTVVFVAIAFLSTILTRDKARGIGISMMLWLYFALLFDGLVLFLFFQFSDYPIEKIVVLLSALSPIDLCRILILLQLDVSAMMGFTGAVFQDFFGNNTGLLLSLGLLLIWSIFPFFLSLIKFKRKDL
jgi:Cu-processing system permease protein